MCFEMTERLKWFIETGDINGFENVIKIVSDSYSDHLQIEDVNKDLGSGRRLIHTAADYGQLEMLELLIKKGADVNVG